MSVDDQRMNVVERDAADLLAFGLHDHEAAIERQMAPLGGDVDDPVHARSRRRG